MAGFNDFIQTELPLRPFVQNDGVAGQILVRSGNPLAVREMIFVDAPTSGAGSNTSLSLIADVNLSGHRAIALTAEGKAIYADHTLSHSAVVIGITTGAAMAGATATVQTSGKLTEPSWNWVPGIVYVGTSGGLTQTAPTVGFVMAIGTALSATEIFIQKQNALILI